MTRSFPGGYPMQSEQIDALIERLENARLRPEMYFGDVDVDAVIHFLNGVRVTTGALIGEDIQIRQSVLADRGWQLSGLHPSREMLERGLSPAKTIDELLVIEIEIIQRLAAKQT
jgi:hypothetical protein